MIRLSLARAELGTRLSVPQPRQGGADVVRLPIGRFLKLSNACAFWPPEQFENGCCFGGVHLVALRLDGDRPHDTLAPQVLDQVGPVVWAEDRLKIIVGRRSPKPASRDPVCAQEVGQFLTDFF